MISLYNHVLRGEPEKLASRCTIHVAYCLRGSLEYFTGKFTHARRAVDMQRYRKRISLNADFFFLCCYRYGEIKVIVCLIFMVNELTHPENAII